MKSAWKVWVRSFVRGMMRDPDVLQRELDEIWLPLLEAAERVNDPRLFIPVAKARKMVGENAKE